VNNHLVLGVVSIFMVQLRVMTMPYIDQNYVWQEDTLRLVEDAPISY